MILGGTTDEYAYSTYILRISKGEAIAILSRCIISVAMLAQAQAHSRQIKFHTCISSTCKGETQAEF